jgi:glycine/D-amino acid oxidase-like deaminating enzyme
MVACDAIVVGGGIVGSSIAFGLARAGLKVVVFDEGDDAIRASRANFGLVAVQMKGAGNPAYHRWTRQSADLWGDFAAELEERTGIDVDFARQGCAVACLNEQEWTRKVAELEQIRAEAGPFGFDYRLLDNAEMADLFPGISRQVLGGAHTTYDGHCSPLYLLRALHRAILVLGGRYVPNARVGRIGASPSRFTVEAGGETVTAPKLVLGAGLGSSALAPQLGLDVPVRPERGQLLVTERVRPMLSLQLGLIRQTAEGSFMLGTSNEDVGYDVETTTRTLGAVARRAVAIMPFLARLSIVRAWAGLRIMTPDGYPIYEQSARFPGAFAVTCHSGVTLAAVHVLCVARHIVAGRVPAELACFSSRRFNVQTAA